MVILKIDAEYLSTFLDLSHVGEVTLQSTGNGLYRLMCRCHGSYVVLANETRAAIAQESLRSVLYLKAYGENGVYRIGSDGEIIRVSIDTLVGDVIGPPVL